MLWWEAQEKDPGSRKGAALTDLQGPKLSDLGGADTLLTHCVSKNGSSGSFATTTRVKSAAGLFGRGRVATAGP